MGPSEIQIADRLALYRCFLSVCYGLPDLPNVGSLATLVLRLLLASFLGGALGYERQRAGKEAGLRTHMLVSLGAALFVLIPLQTGVSPVDMTRVLQGLIVGIGFLGAGTILKDDEHGRVHGLTTAAGVWLTAAIGVAAGMGREASAIVSTVLALMILSALRHAER
jgi:putative Mg2+ transporter-C (MgtC) family protein